MKRYRRQLKLGLRTKADNDAWKDGLEGDIAFLKEHDPKALNIALNHMPPGEARRKWIMFNAQLGRLRQRAESDEDAKKELASMIAAFLDSLATRKRPSAGN
ncbi:hypothetical protein [Bradyrhizobium embrapense]|uniref:hypothetical protein n=1 Tax=Bradyrhizobium embrapense TaxID=630921 RepID=UPI00067E0D16|nr:hypothetical protein [Bradyrhizobium embrapense]